MNISKKELELAGFRRAGTVYPDKAKVLRLDLNWDATGFVRWLEQTNPIFCGCRWNSPARKLGRGWSPGRRGLPLHVPVKSTGWALVG